MMYLHIINNMNKLGFYFNKRMYNGDWEENNYIQYLLLYFISLLYYTKTFL